MNSFASSFSHFAMRHPPKVVAPTNSPLQHYTFDADTILGNSIYNFGTGEYDSITPGADMVPSYQTAPKHGTGSFYKKSTSKQSTSAIICLFSHTFIAPVMVSVCFWYKSLVTSTDKRYHRIFQAQFGEANQHDTNFAMYGAFGKYTYDADRSVRIQYYTKFPAKCDYQFERHELVPYHDDHGRHESELVCE